MDGSINFLFYLIFATMFRACAIGFSCPEGMYPGDNWCCRLCPQGTHLVRQCNVTNGSSFCKQCQPETYMDRMNNATECEKCTQCEPSQLATVDCQPSQNRRCGCERGKYWHSGYLWCMDCERCPKGHGALSPCTETTNTRCQPCPEDTFSDTISFEERCKDCTVCDGGMVKVECNATMDTICERANASGSTTPTEKRHSVSVSPNTASSGQDIVTIQKDKTYSTYIFGLTAVAVLIALVLVVSFCYFIKRRRHRGGHDTSAPPEEAEVTEYNFPVPATSSETPARTRSSHGLRGRRTTHARNTIQQRDSDSQDSNGSLQGVCVEKGKSKTLFRNLPGHIYIDLGKLLNPKSFNNWVTLAGKLGFNNSDVKNFEIHPEEAAQTVLTEWGHRDGSTVEVLIEVLKEMKRDDCVEVLKPWDI